MTQFRCPDCNFVYDEHLGFEREGFAAGTKFDELPSDFACPDCFVRDKEEFIQVEN